MISIIVGIFARIVSNSYVNVFQKILTQRGAKTSAVNFFTYLGLTFILLPFFKFFNFLFSSELLINFIFMGILGALGNYFIIKALSLADLSSLAPINSYKPLVALLFGFLYLNEIPNSLAFAGICLIITGTVFLYNTKINHNKLAVFYRILALVFSGTEAVFIKKIVLLSDIPTSFFLWALSGLIFSLFLVSPKLSKINIPDLKYLFFVILCIGIMQYSTNFVFSKINVSYALALFQLSSLLSVLLGAGVFNEKNIKEKLAACLIMVTGAVLIILAE